LGFSFASSVTTGLAVAVGVVVFEVLEVGDLIVNGALAGVRVGLLVAIVGLSVVLPPRDVSALALLAAVALVGVTSALVLGSYLLPTKEKGKGSKTDVSFQTSNNSSSAQSKNVAWLYRYYDQ